MLAALVAAWVACAALATPFIDGGDGDHLLMPDKAWVRSHRPLEHAPFVEAPCVECAEKPMDRVQTVEGMFTPPGAPGPSPTPVALTSKEPEPCEAVEDLTGSGVAISNEAPAGGSVKVLAAADESEQTSASAPEEGLDGVFKERWLLPKPRARPATDEDPEVQPKVPLVDHEAIKVSSLRSAYRGVVPAVDRTAAPPADAMPPKPAVQELITVGMPDEAAVRSYTMPEEQPDSDETDTGGMPAGTNAYEPRGPMPEGSLEVVWEEDHPCQTCAGHPHHICSHHGLCNNGTCDCHMGWRGIDCSERMCIGQDYVECSGHGVCNMSLCVCDWGWKGDDCSTPSPGCPRPACAEGGPCPLPECSGVEHGKCDMDEGVCECVSPWVGLDCSELGCPGVPAPCSGKGHCWFGKCKCDEGYRGDDCSQLRCPSACSGHGRCDEGECTCATGWSGSDCGLTECPGATPCSGHGVCTQQSTCICNEGWRGGDCGMKRCGGGADECGGHGVCEDGVCKCDPSWGGDACDTRACAVDPSDNVTVCSGHGTCWHGMCQCDAGWTGQDCGGQRCLDDCNNHGICVKGVCQCNGAWTGESCAVIRCATDSDGNECSGQGQCFRGHCVCNAEYKGTVCQSKSCAGYDPADPEKECSMRGLCVQGSCQCDPGWYGEACELKRCMGYPEDTCTGHGECQVVTGTCKCDGGWSSADCSLQTCPGTPSCSGHGLCLHGACRCNVGYRGPDCGVRTCPKATGGVNSSDFLECAGHGSCTQGACVCDSGWGGDVCETRTRCPGQPLECSGNGICRAGSDGKLTCECHAGFKDDMCSSPIGFVGTCEGGSVWTDCKDDNAPMCVEGPPALTYNSRSSSGRATCSQGCQCPAGQKWQSRTRECVTDCLPLVCGDDLTSTGGLSVLTQSCNFSATEAHLENTMMDCVPLDAPLTICWSAGTSNFTSATLSLSLKTFDSLSSERKAGAGPGMTSVETDSLLPDSNNETLTIAQAASRRRNTFASVDLDLSKQNITMGQRINEGQLVPTRTGEHVLSMTFSAAGSDTKRIIHSSFYVMDRQVARCPGRVGSLECSGNGICTQGSCLCSPGYSGKRCDRNTCASGCSGHGSCDVDVDACACDDGWSGPTCDKASCGGLMGLSCNGVGQCYNGTCSCDPGFSGSTCQTPTAHPKCEAGSTWSVCASDCRSGTNTTYAPICGDGHASRSCVAPSAPIECTSRCTCPESRPVWDAVLRRCVIADYCPVQLCGTSLSIASDETDMALKQVPCRNHDHHRCVCAHRPITMCYTVRMSVLNETLEAGGHMGVSIHYDDGTVPGKLLRSTTGIPANVTVAVPHEANTVENEPTLLMPTFGKYQTHLWRTMGADNPSPEYMNTVDLYAQECPDSTVEMQCPGGRLGEGECTGHGNCVNRTCMCDPGWAGNDCGEAATCPGKDSVPCSGHGACSGLACICALGWTGDDCSAAACPFDCSNRGECRDGTCYCDAGWTGAGCQVDTHSFLRCTSEGSGLECSGRGTCNQGVCDCDYGSRAQLCQLWTCPGYPDECSGRGVCLQNVTSAECSCMAGWTGPNCQAPACPAGPDGVDCASHGTCTMGHCECDRGWMGDDCATPKCPGDPACQGHGVCDAGTCQCDVGWKGRACAMRACPTDAGGNECAGHGDCDADGRCACYGGWRGTACELHKCPGKIECSGRGMCVQGKCACETHWTGIDCAVPTCTSPSSPVYMETGVLACSGNGECIDGKCRCSATHNGPHCASLTCPSVGGNVCSGFGACDGATGLCECRQDRRGGACEIAVCPSDCSGHGVCGVDGACTCDPMFTGPACEVRSPPNLTATGPTAATTPALNLLGQKAGPRLAAEGALPLPPPPPQNPADECEALGMVLVDCPPVRMATCSEPGPPAAPSCTAGCACGTGEQSLLWDHSQQKCVKPLACSSDSRPGSCVETDCIHGWCGPRNAFCECKPGYKGKFCDQDQCPGGVNDDGVYVECSGQGSCVEGACLCDGGFTGGSCSQAMCPNGCGAQGECRKGLCLCDDDHIGSACQFLTCPQSLDDDGTGVMKACGGVGVCNHTTGKCRCDHGRRGVACSRKHCPAGCEAHGDCDVLTGVCRCDAGWQGDACDRVGCPKACSGRGTCLADGTCKCEPGYHSADCSRVNCPLGRAPGSRSNTTKPIECSGKGVCIDGACACQSGYVGQACEIKTCPRNCTFHGWCEAGAGICHCNTGRMGADCGRLVCGTGCGGHGRCGEHGECTCEDGWEGLQCSDRPCPGNPPCNGNGRCSESKCECDTRYTGNACQTQLPLFPIRVATPENLTQTPDDDDEAAAAAAAAAAVVAAPKAQTGHVACVFPFIDDEARVHTDCAPATDNKPKSTWCYLSADSPLGTVANGPNGSSMWDPGDADDDADNSSNVTARRWGYCAPRGTCASDELGRECSGRGQCTIVHTRARGLESYCDCDSGFFGEGCSRRVSRVVLGDAREHLRNGLSCQLPFTFKNVTYNDCTSDYSPAKGREWCLLSSRYATGSWGFCAPLGTCPGVTECSGHGSCHDGLCTCSPGFGGEDCADRLRRVTAGVITKPVGQLCGFPFRFMGREYNNCTTAPSFDGDAWCALQPGDFTQGENWDLCAPVGTCPGSPACSGHGSCDDGFCLCTMGFGGTACESKLSQMDALRALYDATDGPGWDIREGWEQAMAVGSNETGSNGTATPGNTGRGICDWHGLECKNTGELARVNLKGNDLHGTVPRQIALLTTLESLDLSSNHLIGSIPSQIGLLESLESLSLANNKLRGTIPETLLDIDPIQRISVEENYLVGGGKTEQQIEHLIHSSFTCDDNCITATQCVKRAEGCIESPASRSSTAQCVCDGGVPPPPGDLRCREDGAQACASCKDGYRSGSTHTCVPNQCKCSHGTPVQLADERCLIDGHLLCVMCNKGYTLVGPECVEDKDALRKMAEDAANEKAKADEQKAGEAKKQDDDEQAARDKAQKAADEVETKRKEELARRAAEAEATAKAQAEEAAANEAKAAQDKADKASQQESDAEAARATANAKADKEAEEKAEVARKLEKKKQDEEKAAQELADQTAAQDKKKASLEKKSKPFSKAVDSRKEEKRAKDADEAKAAGIDAEGLRGLRLAQEEMAEAEEDLQQAHKGSTPKGKQQTGYVSPSKTKKAKAKLAQAKAKVASASSNAKASKVSMVGTSTQPPSQTTTARH